MTAYDPKGAFVSSLIVTAIEPLEGHEYLQIKP